MNTPTRIQTIAGYDDTYVFYAGKAYEYFTPPQCPHLSDMPDEVLHLHFLHQSGEPYCFVALAEDADFYRLAGDEPWAESVSGSKDAGCALMSNFPILTGSTVVLLLGLMVLSLSLLICGFIRDEMGPPAAVALLLAYMLAMMLWPKASLLKSTLAAVAPTLLFAVLGLESMFNAAGTALQGSLLIGATVAGGSLAHLWLRHRRHRCDACRAADPTEAIGNYLARMNDTTEEDAEAYRTGMETKANRPE